MCPILAIAILRSIINHVSHALSSGVTRSGTTTVVDYVQDQMHLPQADAESRKHVDPGLLVPLFGNLEQLLGVPSRDGGYRAEEDVGAVGHPIEPCELVQIWDPRGYTMAGPKVVVRRYGRRFNVTGSWHFPEFFVDDVEFVLADIFGAVGSSIVDPCTVATRELG